MIDGINGLDLSNMINSAFANHKDGTYGDSSFLLLFLLILFGANGGNWGNRNNGDIEAAIAKARSADVSDAMIMQGINGNKAAIDALAAAFNCNNNTIQTTLAGLDKSIALVAGQIGTSTQNVINAVQSGDASVINAIQTCCCNMKEALGNTNNLITQLSYENRIQNMQQTTDINGVTNAGFTLIGQKIDNQTLQMNAGFQSIRDIMCQDKIDTLRDEVSILRNNKNNSEQTAILQGQLNAILARMTPNPVPAYIVPQYNGCGCNNA